MNDSNRIFALTLGLIALVIGAFTAYRLVPDGHFSVGAPPPELEFVLLPEPVDLPEFRLTDFNGKEFGLGRFIGSWTMLFFGYTHCPDVCPTTMAELKQTMARLREQDSEAASELQVYFISLDPKRDKPEGLKTYLGYFDPTFVGATGDAAVLDRLARGSQIAYMVEGDTARDDYIINHSATILLLDPQGRIYAQLGPPHTPADLANKFLRVREFYNR